MIVQNLKNHFQNFVWSFNRCGYGFGFTYGRVRYRVGLFRIAKTNLFSTNLKNLFGLKSQSFANRNKIKKVVIPFRQVSLQLTLNLGFSIWIFWLRCDPDQGKVRTFMNVRGRSASKLDVSNVAFASANLFNFKVKSRKFGRLQVPVLVQCQMNFIHSRIIYYIPIRRD